MKDSKEIIEVLNDLIKINGDRVEGYEKAADQVHTEVTLKGLFYQLSEESRECRDNLSEKVKELGGDPVENSTTNRGKIYRAWMDVRATFSGDDAETTLSSCEFGEDAAQRAYQQAVQESNEFPNDIRLLILNQKDQLKLSHDLIKNQRDQYKSVAHE